MKTLERLWEKGYKFIESTDWGIGILQDFEEVEDIFEETEFNEWLDLDIEIDHETRTVRLDITNNE